MYRNDTDSQVTRGAVGAASPGKMLLGLSLLLACVGAVRVQPAAELLWSRSQALATLYHPTLPMLGSGSLPRAAFLQLVSDRSSLLSGMQTCIGTACSHIADAAAGAGDGKWVAGRFVENPLTGVKDAAETLAELMSSEADRIETDCVAWCCEDVRRCTDVDARPEVVALREHLISAQGPFAQLGCAAAVARTMGWMHATLVSAKLSGGAEEAYAGWIDAHATRWSAVADACEATFDAARGALDAGATQLSLGGGLSDVECAVALREASTANSLLSAWLEAASEAGGGDGAAGDDDASLDAARAAIEAVEPGYLTERETAVFVRGVGLCDASAQQAARQKAAQSYLAAREAEGASSSRSDE